MTRLATCHPERPVKARGLCSACHQRFRRRKLAGPGPAHCTVCTRWYIAKRPTRSLVCSGVCARFRRGQERSRAVGLRQVRYWKGCDEAAFKAELRRQVFAGRELVGPRTRSDRMAGRYSAWKRKHAEGALYVIRWADEIAFAEAA